MIEAHHLSKTYAIVDKKAGLLGSIQSFFRPQKRYIPAVKDISLSVQKGEIIGYIGSNGSGKSTTIKMLTGVLYPDEGQVLINGLEPSKARIAVNRQIGVLFGQKSHLKWDIPVIESFFLHAKIYDVPDAIYQERLKRLTELLELTDILNQPVRNLSLGQRVKCEFAAIFLHQPAVVFLDEPTIGLDASVKELIRDFIRTMNQEFQTTFLITSHDMQDIESLCERIVIIDKGQKVYDGSLTHLKENFSKIKTIAFTTHTAIEAPLTAPHLEWVQLDSHQFEIHYQTAHLSNAQIIQLAFEQYAINDVTMKEITIEQIVKRIYEEGLHD